MGGSVLHDPAPVPLARPSAVVQVVRQDDAGDWWVMPNVVCVSITKRVGAPSWLARLRYTFGGPLASPDDPARLEHVFPLDAAGDGVLTPDTTVGVRAVRDDGYTEWLFTGFVGLPQADLDREAEAATLTAVGMTEREWDRPIEGAVQRDYDDPTAHIPGTLNRRTSAPARVNPDGKANATPATYDLTVALDGGASGSFPVFLGPVAGDVLEGQTLRKWTLDLLAAYLVGVGIYRSSDSTFPASDRTPWIFVDSLDFSDDLITYEPTTPGGAVDLTDSGSYTTAKIDVQDIDVTGQPWPEAVDRVVEPHGFRLVWVLVTDSSGEPQWSF